MIRLPIVPLPHLLDQPWLQELHAAGSLLVGLGLVIFGLFFLALWGSMAGGSYVSDTVKDRCKFFLAAVVAGIAVLLFGLYVMVPAAAMVLVSFAVSLVRGTRAAIN